MEYRDQLLMWVEGSYVHDEENDRCCPDFSCCNKKMETDRTTKERFLKAVEENDEKTKTEMLGMFLAQAMGTLGSNVYVAGLDSGGNG